tara:strand:- start:10136 stop:11197 length:1062 start_codon:yes stop_codon:yes gene_type:complete
MKSILVTGGCGFIGSHTCLVLLNANYNLLIIDSNINSRKISLEKIIEIGNLVNKNYRDKIIFIKGDIRDKNLINSIFSESIQKKLPIEAVVHFAGLKSVEKSVSDPLLYWENNVLGSLVLFNEMERFNCKKIVFSSSATVYATKKNNKNIKKVYLSENSDLKPSNPYGNTKLAIEKILNDICSSSINNWSVINLRYFNPIGAHPSGMIGENPLNLPDNLFPYICRVASKKISKLNIYGSDWPTVDGTCIRDFVHVMDLADAHLRALEYLFKNKPQNVNLNIGTGIGTTVLQLVKTFEKTTGLEVPYQFSSRRPGDVPILIADNKLAKKILDWEPKKNLYDMCKDGWAWHRKNH